MIPAPFDVLEGTLRLKAEGPVRPLENSYDFPILFSAELSSARQKIALDTEAVASLAKTFDALSFDVNARIQDFQIELPPLDPIAGLPRVVPDGRILLKPPKPKKNAPLRNSKSIFAFRPKPRAPGRFVF